MNSCGELGLKQNLAWSKEGIQRICPLGWFQFIPGSGLVLVVCNSEILRFSHFNRAYSWCHRVHSITHPVHGEHVWAGPHACMIHCPNQSLTGLWTPHQFIYRRTFASKKRQLNSGQNTIVWWSSTTVNNKKTPQVNRCFPPSCNLSAGQWTGTVLC